MTDLDLDAIQARADAATDGPWTLHRTSTLYINGHTGYYLRRDDQPGQIFPLTCLPGDAEFIAHARQDVPDLVAEIRRLRAELADVRKVRPAMGSQGSTGSAPAEFEVDPRFRRPGAS